MRGTAWVNAFQAAMFLSFGAAALVVIGRGMGGFSSAVESLLATPTTSLLTRERISPWFFFSYTFVPLSTIAFPHISIFCLTARRMAQFRPTVVLYPSAFSQSGCRASFSASRQTRSATRRELRRSSRHARLGGSAHLSVADRAALRRQASGDDVVLVMLERFAPL